MVVAIETLVNNFYIGDLLDIIIIALLIYIALFLFKQTRSLLMLIGFGILLSIYVLAQIFGLYLTTIVFQSFFSVFLIVLVIIFQEELRRFLEFIAAVSTRQARSKYISTGSDPIHEILQALACLVHEKFGALIVLCGQENIDRHIEGGTLLDGIVSEDLIVSIFDPSSQGHDGAIIIYKNRILKFGAHLPLSSNFKEVGKRGTRHSAALGISERSDALVIVVSEEQGTISIALGNTLKTIKNIEELREELAQFFKEKSTSALENLVKRNSTEKMAALVVASLLWFFISFRADSVQRDFILPISYRNVPENVVIEDSKPQQLTVTIESRGESAFDHLDQDVFDVNIDASNISDGQNTIQIRENMISRPLNFSVVNISPQNIQVTAIKYKSVSTPIEARTTGHPATGFQLGNIILSQNAITLLVPDAVTPPQTIETESINVSGLRETATLSANLKLPQNIRLKENEPSSIDVTVEIRRR